MSVLSKKAESDCFKTYRHDDFDPKLVDQTSWKECPVKKCGNKSLDKVEAGRRSLIPVCVKHGIRLHTRTFVYWNGNSKESKAKAKYRNIWARQQLAEALIKGRTGKVESGRLGHEMSEDALSWNVFAGLSETVGGLSKATKYLCGTAPSREPDLYLWGLRISEGGNLPGPFPPLAQVRAMLENPSLPANEGPGFFPNGHFVLTELVVHAMD